MLNKIKNILAHKSKPSGFDIAILLRQLATLFSAGIPLLKCFNILEKTQFKFQTSLLIISIKKNILAGKNLAHSLRQHSNYFNESICELVNIGEQTGKVDMVLNMISLHLEKRIAFKKKLKQILFYPAFIILMALIVTVLMVVVVIPRFAELYQNNQEALPLLTICIFSVAKMIQQHIFLITNLFFSLLLIIIASFFYIEYFTDLKIHWQQYFNQIIFKIPFFKNYLTKIYLTNFVRNLAILLAAGIPLMEALKLSDQQSIIHPIIFKLRMQVYSGFTLAAAMQIHPLFPILMIQMIKIGEESGKLDTMLNKIADIFEAEIDQFIHFIGEILEPLIMGILGVLIGGLVIGMYLPIFKLGTAI